MKNMVLLIDADFIVTENIKDYSASRIPAVTPAEMLDIASESE